MKFCWKKFPRQDRLCGKKSRYGSRLALREKKFLRIQKTQELFPGQSSQSPKQFSNKKPARDPSLANPPSQRPRRRPNVRQASQRETQALSRCPQASQRPRQPAKRQQLSQNPRHPSLIPSRILSISRSGILHKRSKS